MSDTGSTTNASTTNTGTSSTADTAAAAKDAFSNAAGQVKDLASKKPYAFAALAGVLGIALINTLRGKR